MQVEVGTRDVRYDEREVGDAFRSRSADAVVFANTRAAAEFGGENPPIFIDLVLLRREFYYKFSSFLVVSGITRYSCKNSLLSLSGSVEVFAALLTTLKGGSKDSTQFAGEELSKSRVTSGLE